MTPSARSLLYVPGDRADRLAKAWERGADALIVDLEDAVPPDRKEAARQIVAEWLADQGARSSDSWLRVTTEDPARDIAAMTAPVGAVIIPKAEVESVAAVAGLLDAHEAERGWPGGSIATVPLIETARGLLQAPELAAGPRVRTLMIGRADLAGELGLRIDPEGPEFRSLLLGIVVACAAAGSAPPIAPTSTDFRDLDALRDSTRALLALGFRGRTAVHPAQVPVINEVFTPTDAELTEARAIVERFERGGRGAQADQGQMVDAAVVRRARDVLARAR